MDSGKKKRERCISFSAEEKLLIANICARYKHVLENKKTDNISVNEKNKIWDKIATQVNSAALNSTYRTPDVLKRFYENRKREVRKLAAEERKEIFATGGGNEIKIKKDACHDIFFSIMNRKTVYGLENGLDGDAETGAETFNNSSLNSVPSCSQFNDIEIVYETDDLCDKEQEDKEKSMNTWKKYIPADLKTKITPNLQNFEENEVSKKISITEEEKTGTPQAHNKRRHPLSSSRRRPSNTIKALTRSELSEKYDLLLDKRLELVTCEKKKIEQEILTIEGERELKFELLKLQIEIEKEKLKKLVE